MRDDIMPRESFRVAIADWGGPSFFGAKLGKVARSVGDAFVYIVLAQAFNRRMVDGHVSGVGLLQVGRRHLLYVGQADGKWKVCAGFCWLLGDAS